MKIYIENKVTVYTPTYNRGYCLHQLYDSLVRQNTSFDNFEWLIVDDGSNDNTEMLVSEWMKEASFKITYFKQKNEGKMAKLNFIHQILETELCMCIDSDDYLLDDAIGVILDTWSEIKEKDGIAGLVGLNIYKDGVIVGTNFPCNNIRIRLSDFDKKGIHGDKKLIYKTKVLSKYPSYPNFENEKFPAPGYLYMLIDVDYDLWTINKSLCVVEYLEDGLSKNKFVQFRKAPNSWMFYRLERMRLANGYKEKFKNAIHYVSSCIFAQKPILSKNPYVITTLFAIPFGLLLNLYLRRTNTKGVVK